MTCLLSDKRTQKNFANIRFHQLFNRLYTTVTNALS